jgi:branched-chain amino acid transport system substrate-binding protein
VGGRWLCLAALAALGASAQGCGGVGGAGASETGGNQLAVYSSLPLQGPMADISAEIVDGEKLALAQAGGHVGPFSVGYVSLDDADPKSGKLDPGATATDAKTAAQDTTTIAYLGEYDSAATAVSLPLINAAGILQVSPASPYVGLTSTLDAGQDEPQRFYPTGVRTFARLQGGDPAQAAAQVQLLRLLGVHRLYVIDDQDPFVMPLARMVSAQAESAGVRVLGHDSIATTAGSIFTGEVEKVAASGAQAVFFAGSGGPGAAALWRALHRADGGLLLLGSSAMVDDGFASRLGAAAASAYLTTPILSLGSYPPAAARVLAEYRRRFGRAGGAYALYGYEAMSAVLDAIRRAGTRGNDRRAVIDRFFAARTRGSVVGRFSIGPDGEADVSRFGVDRVIGGRATFYRALALGPY